MIRGMEENMEAEMKKCANENCGNILPEGWKHEYCAACRSRRRKQTIMDLLCAPGIVAMKIATRGNRRSGQDRAEK